jgi:ubiquinone/menaquinone biosynthesis C-methylase UbiE
LAEVEHPEEDIFMSNLMEPWPRDGVGITSQSSLEIPAYLQETYWWAYVHPNAVAFFERQWLVNLILWGNFVQLREAALGELGSKIHGSTLQIACVYGDFSAQLAQRINQGGSLDIVDVLPIQLDNVRKKLPAHAPVRILLSDSTKLKLASQCYDQAIIFFLLHEQPASARAKTLSEVLRVLKPGGKLVIVDYHLPSIFHPLRYLFKPLLKHLEPFALDLWHEGIESWLPKEFIPLEFTKETFFGGLYQKVVIRV